MSAPRMSDNAVEQAHIVSKLLTINGDSHYVKEPELKDWQTNLHKQTTLQEHSAYWDKDHDGVIWPIDTWRGTRAWGWNIFLSMLVVGVIHGGLSYATLPATFLLFPDPFFRVYQNGVHRAKHGSDTMSYDNRGHFRAQAFDELFANYDKGNKGGLSATDLIRMWHGQRNAFDPFGWSAFMFEWLATYLLIWPADGVLRKEDVRAVYDGSIFQRKADEFAAKQKRA